MEMISSPRLGFLRGVFLANHLASNDNLTRTTKRPYFNRGLKADKKRNLKLKINNANTVTGISTNNGNCMYVCYL